MESLRKRFLWSSFNAKNFSEMPDAQGDVIVVVANAHNPSIAIFNAEGLSSDEKMELAKKQGVYLTSGSNYYYDVVRVIGNTYFLN